MIASHTGLHKGCISGPIHWERSGSVLVTGILNLRLRVPGSNLTGDTVYCLSARHFNLIVLTTSLTQENVST